MADMGRAGCRNDGSSMPCPARLPHIAARHASASASSSAPPAQQPAQVGLLLAEQAVADLPVGGEPGPVAGAAERLGHARDDADPGRLAVDAGVPVDQPGLGRRRAAFDRIGSQRVDRPQLGQDLVAGTMFSRRQACWASSGICSMKRSS